MRRLKSYDYQKIWEEDLIHNRISINDQDWLYQESWQNQIWQRHYQFYQLRHGLSLEIGKTYNLETWELEIEHSSHYPLSFAFQIAGDLQVYTANLQPDFYHEKAGENYIFLVAGTKEIEQRFQGETTQSIRIRLDREFLASFTADYSESLTEDILNFINDQNPPAFYYRLGKSTAMINLLLQQILTCPYEGLFKQFFLESKTLELMTLQLSQLKQIQTQSSIQKISQKYLPAIYQAAEILQHQFDQPPSLLELAQQVELTERNLQRGFHHCFGTSAFQYLHQIRMEQAQELLLTGQMNVTEVANRVGYSHLSHFAAAFKRYCGQTPSQYAKV